MYVVLCTLCVLCHISFMLDVEIKHIFCVFTPYLKKSSNLYTLCNFVLTDFHTSCIAGMRMKFGTKPTLGMLLHYLGKLKMQISGRL